MPLYDYSCSHCGSFEALRPVAQGAAAACPVCGTASPRVFISAPHLPRLNAATRSARDTNERAQHAPLRSADAARHQHTAGCGCGSSNKPGTGVSTPIGKIFPNRRPWMISH